MLTSQMDGPATSRPRSRPGRDMPSTSRNDHPADADKGGHPNGHPTTHAADPERPFRRCRRPHLTGGAARRGWAVVRRVPGRPGVADLGYRRRPPARYGRSRLDFAAPGPGRRLLRTRLRTLLGPDPGRGVTAPPHSHPAFPQPGRATAPTVRRPTLRPGLLHRDGRSRVA